MIIDTCTLCCCTLSIIWIHFIFLLSDISGNVWINNNKKIQHLPSFQMFELKTRVLCILFLYCLLATCSFPLVSAGILGILQHAIFFSFPGFTSVCTSLSFLATTFVLMCINGAYYIYHTSTFTGIYRNFLTSVVFFLDLCHCNSI